MLSGCMATQETIFCTTGNNETVLRQKAQDVSVPLSVESLDIINSINEIYKNEPTMAGLAAPQIGYSSRIIGFGVPEDVKKFRNNVEKIIPWTILINPTYTVHKDKGTSFDWEACFSVPNKVGRVKRYNRVTVKGFIFDTETKAAKPYKKIHNGFAARLLQHEIDHLNGVLYTDLIKNEKDLMDLEVYKAMRLKQIEKQSN